MMPVLSESGASNRRSNMSGARYYVGCQSWGYDDWITPAGGSTVFYPRGTKRSDMLELYSRIFNTIEVDATLYGIPVETTIRNWYNETPENFKFSLKFPREVTHDHALRGPSAKITAEFVDRASLLHEKLGLFLIQFPAAFESTRDNIDALGRYLEQLPSDFRFAIEFRNAGWFIDQIFTLLEEARVSLCLVEGKWVDRTIMFNVLDRGNTDFRYIRIMGERDLPRFDRIYRHRDDALDLWAGKIRSLSATQLYIYSDNYFEGFAPATVNKVLSRLGLTQGDPSILDQQGSLF
jgi:uncharacterized protein YecE (DUF72 family)